MRTVYPWSAVVGQDALKHALLLCAIDPSIGGVLVQGPRGVAKTTLARALGQLVSGSFVELPLGASEERVTGSLDLDSVLREQKVSFSPGLLARAHEGVLYVDEVNLLPDALVDLLLDAAATGRNTVERDGISHAHPARFVLVGTMNPEEGELRPQLTDRFGLSVQAHGDIVPSERTQIVAHRLAYDADPEAFVASHASQQAQLAARVQRARECARTISLVGAAIERVGELCYAAQVEGVRADLAMLRAARAHAAWHERAVITTEDVEAVAELALAHRRQARTEPPKPGPRGGGSPSGGAPTGGSGPTPSSGGASTPRSQAPAPSHAAARNEAAPSSAAADSSAAARSSAAADSGTATAPDTSAQSQAEPSRASERGALAPVSVRASAVPKLPSWLTSSRGSGAEARKRGAARRSATSGRRSTCSEGALGRAIDWFATLAHAPRPTRLDLRYRARHAPDRQLWVLALDCSASMLRGGSLAAAKAVAYAFEARAVRQGAHVALISFSGGQAQLRASHAAGRATRERALRDLGAGGGTPLQAALHEAYALCSSRKFQSVDVAKRIVLLTDGRTKEQALPPDDASIDVVVIDCERGPVRLGRAATLAAQLAAPVVHVDTLR